MANGYKIIPSKAQQRRHDRRNRLENAPPWVRERTHGKFGGRGGRKNGQSVTTTPENLPQLRAMSTGLGSGQVFLHDPR
jgi:hypothetical protein